MKHIHSQLDAAAVRASFDGQTLVTYRGRRGKSRFQVLKQCPSILLGEFLTAHDRARAGVPSHAYVERGLGGWSIYTLPPYDAMTGTGVPRAYSGTRTGISKQQRRAGGRHVIRGW